MPSYSIKYIYVKIDTEEISSTDLNSALTKFAESHEKSDNCIYHVMDIKENSDNDDYDDHENIINLTSGENFARFKNVNIDSESHEIYSDKSRIRLTDREYDIFMYLLRCFEQPKSASQILEAVYGYAPVLPSDTKLISTMVSKIRKKLNIIEADFSLDHIKGLGYKFVVK